MPVTQREQIDDLLETVAEFESAWGPLRAPEAIPARIADKICALEFSSGYLADSDNQDRLWLAALATEKSFVRAIVSSSKIQPALESIQFLTARLFGFDNTSHSLPCIMAVLGDNGSAEYSHSANVRYETRPGRILKINSYILDEKIVYQHTPGGEAEEEVLPSIFSELRHSLQMHACLGLPIYQNATPEDLIILQLQYIAPSHHSRLYLPSHSYGNKYKEQPIEREEYKTKRFFMDAFATVAKGGPA